ncbi:MAG: orotidine-5'-phosphate decarboxylase [Spirochaetes bacterium]|nr:orotidine-5'-phosphate decarboxylase [Spirochaetota bacterium]
MRKIIMEEFNKDDDNINISKKNQNDPNIYDLLIDKIIEKKSPFCVGLDTNPHNIPDFLLEETKSELFLARQNSLTSQNQEYYILSNTFGFNNILIGNSILKFNKILIDKIKNYVPAVKIQIAFYELIGPYGLYIFKKTIDYAKQNNLFVISDIKRNDIDSTAKAYSDGFLSNNLKIKNYIVENFDSNFITINPYLGKDGLLPFIENCYKFNKGVFVLAKTSNPSSSQIQDKIIDGQELFKHVIKIIKETENELIEKLNKENIETNIFSNKSYLLNSKYNFYRAGIVVGATYPEVLQELRLKYPDIFFLIPGIGKQGGKISDIKKVFKDKYVGAIINVSRSVIFAYLEKKTNPEYFAEEALNEIKRLNDEFNS